jgi:hypothetical protein
MRKWGVSGILQHERALQSIGNKNDGSRHAQANVTGTASKSTFKLAS